MCDMYRLHKGERIETAQAMTTNVHRWSAYVKDGKVYCSVHRSWETAPKPRPAKVKNMFVFIPVSRRPE